MSTPQTSPLTTRLYDLEYPRSLGVYSTYAEVQTVVDTLADHEFPVQHTMIVGTDLKLMERVTGRKTWGRVIGRGVLSGLWMGLFLGLLFMLLTPGSLVILLTTVLMGVLFFVVWSVIGYAMTGGKRDFTSMVATIPMQYELMVEHSHAQRAREILASEGAAMPTPQAASPTVPPAAGPGTGNRPGFGQPAPSPEASPAPARPSNRPSYGRPAEPTGGSGDSSGNPPQSGIPHESGGIPPQPGPGSGDGTIPPQQPR